MTNGFSRPEDVVVRSASGDAGHDGPTVPDSASVSFHPPDTKTSHQANAFREQGARHDWFENFDGRGSGRNGKWVWFDPAKDKTPKPGVILVGGQAWDQHLKHSDGYNFHCGDIHSNHFAVMKGILDMLPNTFHIRELGPGGSIGFKKTEALLSEFIDSGHLITRYVAEDIHLRYAAEAAFQAFSMGVKAYAQQTDFMNINPNRKYNRPEAIEPELILVQGGPLANAPETVNGRSYSGRQNAARYLAKQNYISPMGSFLWITFQKERNPAKLLAEYEGDEENKEIFRHFVLSGFNRAVKNGTITTPSYNPLDYWDYRADYDDSIKAVRLNAVCEVTHTISTVHGDRHAPKGKTQTEILSHKWDETDWENIFDAAGIKLIESFSEPETNRGVLLAKSVAEPKISLT